MLTTDLERRMSDTMEASAAALVSRLRACQSRMQGLQFLLPGTPGAEGHGPHRSPYRHQGADAQAEA